MSFKFMGRRFYNFPDFLFRMKYYISMNLRRDGFFNKRYYVRPFVKQLIERFGDKGLIGAEIGVWRGWFSKIMLRKFNMAQLYCIDPYIRNAGIAGCERDKKIAYDNLQRYIEFDNNVSFTYKKSLDCDFADNIFDFVYLDGEHKFSTVYAELRKYYNYVKSGGLLGGHDINQIQVAIAVIRFCEEYGLEYSFQDLDFWIWKPDKDKKVDDSE